jgi:cAMP-dependent protein kinase regulator
VSAEAFGIHNKKGDFKASVIAKSEDTKKKIVARLNMAFMFSALDEKEKQIVVDAMGEKKAKPGEYIIKQGEEGDNLYVVESGTLSCSKLFAGKAEPTFLKKFQPGDSFGELALLYNAPRAATIVADTDAVLWSLDRNTFNHIVKDAASKKREKYEDFLTKVQLLSTMEPYERSKLADAFKEEAYQAGETIIKEGDEGNVFYIVEQGECVATKTLKQGSTPSEVKQYKVGDYFGERALLKNEPRAANVIAKTNCVVVQMDRHSFKRLMGPLEEILKRNMDLYESFK